jgi:hypothetical protein
VDINDLIERSSLGSPAARALRARTPRWAAEAAVRRSRQPYAVEMTLQPDPAPPPWAHPDGGEPPDGWMPWPAGENFAPTPSGREDTNRQLTRRWAGLAARVRRRGPAPEDPL